MSTLRVRNIRHDLANTDYQEYLKWLEAGNLPIPAESTESLENSTPEPADDN